MDRPEVLWRSYKKHPRPEVREALVHRYLRLAKLEVDRMKVPDCGLFSGDDLVGYAILGLIDAVEKYDPDRDVKFETYAAPRIRGAVVDALRRMDRMPRSLRQKEKEIGEAYARLERIFGRPATDDEVADELGLSPDALRAALAEVAPVTLVSLDQGFDSPDVDGGGDLRDLLPGPSDTLERVEQGERKRMLAEAIGGLPERERLVVGLYYYEGLTLKEIGQVLGVTEARVSQMHAKALFRLRGQLQRCDAVFI